MAAYRFLLEHEVKAFLRLRLKRHPVLVRILLGLLAAYVVFSLVAGGVLFEALLHQMAPTLAAAETLNGQLLSMLIGLFGLRFLLQKPPMLRFQPYLHLPVERIQIIRFFQLRTLFSPHNVLPFCFLIPFAWVTLMPHHTWFGVLTWLFGMGCLILLSNYTNTLLRLALAHRTERIYWIFGACLLWIGLDYLVGTRYLEQASLYLFGLLLEGNALVLLFAIAAIDVYILSTDALIAKMMSDSNTHPPARPSSFLRSKTERLGPVGQLMLLEARLLWRNKRPKHFFLLSLVFSTGYLAFMLLSEMDQSGYALAAFVGLLASGSFALNYGQLMFSWESSYFDGLLMHTLDPAHLIKSKLWILQGSCILLYVLSLPLVLWLRPTFLSLHAAFLLYNMGITCLLMLFLALSNRKGINVERSGSFFNYEGFSVAHWLWFLPTAVPPIVLLLWLNDPFYGPAALALVGGASVLMTPWWIHLFTYRFSRTRHRMAESFRAYAD